MKRQEEGRKFRILVWLLLPVVGIAIFALVFEEAPSGYIGITITASPTDMDRASGTGIPIDGSQHANCRSAQGEVDPLCEPNLSPTVQSSETGGTTGGGDSGGQGGSPGGNSGSGGGNESGSSGGQEVRGSKQDPTDPDDPSSGAPAERSKQGASNLIIQRPLMIVDQAGDHLGSGEVALYAPDEITLGMSAMIILEIAITDVDPDVFVNAAPSPTPIIGTPRPTPSPLPLVDIQFIEVRQVMGAAIRGVDLDHFTIDEDPINGILVMQPNAVNRWIWTIRADSLEAVGENTLVVYVYWPNQFDNGTEYREEKNTFLLPINVLAPPTLTPAATLPMIATPTVASTATPTSTATPIPGEEINQTSATLLDIWLERLVGIGTLTGLLYAGYKYLKERQKRGK